MSCRSPGGDLNAFGEEQKRFEEVFAGLGSDQIGFLFLYLSERE